MIQLVQVFISYSSEDSWLIDQFASMLRNLGIIPYLAQYNDPVPIPVDSKLRNAISGSSAIFVFYTKNVADVQSTRDIVNWELSTADALRKKIFMFAETGAEIPWIFKYKLSYFSFDPLDQSSLDEVSFRIQIISDELKKQQPWSFWKTMGISFLVAGIVAVLSPDDDNQEANNL